VVIVVFCGMYYIKALYGPSQQCVLYIQPLNSEEQIIKIKEILNKTKRKALFISMANSESNISLIRASFPSLVELKTNFDAGPWRVLYEK